MRFVAFAALAVLAIGLTDVRPASAKAWECVGPAVACSDAPHASKKAAYKKASYKKASYKKAASKKASYKKAAYKRTDKATRAARLERRAAKRSVAKYDTGSYGGSSGVASYYWQGQRTASGARFNPDGLTAAHRTLPFGTRVVVTNHSNGRSVTVTINDRGPFIKGRVIDLSRGAAAAIGMTGAGLARVSYTVVGRG
ncbi:MAG: septal ring lytic transglycosylase RlpA family protein [Hyphomicrobium sp.]|uniref:septal ring lytic transglycosylase RlpA family protein n=1 Tax=Hyphomicrobium sp. TaxID=82 RepID=UPI003D11B46E